MKKILAIALALVMIMSLAVFASAAETTLPDLDCSGWWTAHTEGLQLTEEGFTATFTATAYDSATFNWNAPIFILYAGTEAKVNGAGYNEYWVHRADNYGWAGAWGNFVNTADMAALNAMGVTVEAAFEEGCWDNWVTDMQAGEECVVTAKLEGSNAVASISCHGVTNTVTVPVDAANPVYLSLSGELCKLTNIKVTTPDAEPEGLVAMMKFADADYAPYSMGSAPTPINGAGTYTLTVENITATFGAGLDYANMLYIEVEGGYETLKDFVVSDVSVIVDGEAIAVNQDFVWTYESLGTDYLPNGNYCIEIYNAFGYSGAGYGAAIDPAIFADESISITFTLSEPAAAPVVPTIEDGKYVISWNGLTFAALAEDKGYGYPVAGTVDALTDADYITVTNVGDGQFTMQDCYGRYIFMKGTYNSFNVSAEMPTEGYLWVLEETEGGYLLKNVEKEKYLAYSEQYTSWGCYPEISATSVVTITTPNPGTGDAIFAVLAIFAASGMGLTAVVSKKK